MSAIIKFRLYRDEEKKLSEVANLLYRGGFEPVGTGFFREVENLSSMDFFILAVRARKKINYNKMREKLIKILDKIQHPYEILYTYASKTLAETCLSEVTESRYNAGIKKPIEVKVKLEK